VSRDGWLVVWAIAFLAAAAFARWATPAGTALTAAAALPLFAVVLSPVVLRIAEDVASHAVSRVIETDPENRTPLLMRFAMDGLSGLGLGALVGLLAFGVIDITIGTAAGSAPLAFAISIATPLGVAVLLVTLVGTLLSWIAERRAEKGKRVSQSGIAVALMLVGVICTIGLMIGSAIITSGGA
jgi:hypothetical protein